MSDDRVYTTRARCNLDLDSDDDQRHRCHTCGSRVRVLPPADTCPIERRLMALTIAREAGPEGLTWAVDEGLVLQLVPADADIGEAWRWTIGDSANDWESGVGATAADAVLKATRLESARADALAAMSAAAGVAPEDAHLAALEAVRMASEAGCTCSQPPTWPMWRSVHFRDPDSGLHVYP